MLVAVICYALACSPATSVPPRAAPSTPPPDLEVTEQAVGPLTAKTPATLASLRKLLVGLDVTERDQGGIEFLVSRHGEPLFVVVPDEDGTIFNIHVMSTASIVAGHDWRPGTILRSADAFSACDCWGDNPVCFKSGEHVAAAFDRSCEAVDDPRQLVGARVARTIWNPRPFSLVELGLPGDEIPDVMPGVGEDRKAN